MARFPMTHLPCLTSSWVMSTDLRDPAHRVESRLSEESPRIARGRPPAISIALRQSQMDIFDFLGMAEASELFHEIDSTAGRGWYYFPVAVPPFSLVNSGLSRSARSGPGREAAQSGPLTARTDLESSRERERRELQAGSPQPDGCTNERFCNDPVPDVFSRA